MPTTQRLLEAIHPRHKDIQCSESLPRPRGRQLHQQMMMHAPTAPPALTPTFVHVQVYVGRNEEMMMHAFSLLFWWTR